MQGGLAGFPSNDGGERRGETSSIILCMYEKDPEIGRVDENQYSCTCNVEILLNDCYAG